MSETTIQDIVVAGVRPERVYQPASIEELCDLMRTAPEATLVPRGSGTRLDLGGPPKGPFAVVDLAGALDRSIEHRHEDLTAFAGAGATIGDVNEALAVHGQRLPLDPPGAPHAMIGGLLAAGGGGPLRTRWGLPRDLVIGMTVIRADGETVKAGGRVVKNVTGYDLVRLWCGSLGTLGIIAQTGFKVLPIAETVDLVTRTGRLEDVLVSADRLLRHDVRPEVFDALAEGDTWRMVARVPAASEAVARPQLAGERLPDDPEAYIRCRDLGSEPDDLLTLHGSVAFPGVRDLARQVAGLKPARMLVRPLTGEVRAAWDAASLPPLRSFGPALDQLRSGAAGRGASVIIERMPPSFHASLSPWGDVPAAFDLMRAVKATWDPRGRLNAGRYAGGL